MANPVLPGATNRMPLWYERNPHRWLRLLAWMLGVFVLVVTGYFLIVWPVIQQWGATRAEVEQGLPGDELVPDAALVTTKAVTVRAAPEDIWPWLAQLGVDRGGMYSYLWVENWLMRLDVANSDVIRPEWQRVQVGDFIRFTPKEYALNPGPGLYVMGVEPNHALTGCFGLEDAPSDCLRGGTWQFVLSAQGDGTTRLILRSRLADPGTAWALLGNKIAQGFVFYMERKMLVEIKARAEANEMQYGP